MPYTNRVDLYQQIEDQLKRPLIVYVTSLRHNAGGKMASDVIAEFIRQIYSIEKTESKIAILLVSNGGDPTVAWRIISLLRERFSDIVVLLPFAAYSAATLLAMGANKIIMHPFANLGPIDPQIVSGDNQKPGQFGAEDLVHYLSFVKYDVGITDQAELQEAFRLLCREVGAIPIGTAKRSIQLSIFLGEKLLNFHMNDKNKAQAIVESLNKSFYHHGYPVGRTEAKQIGLPVEDPAENLENLMWEIWQSIEDEMQCNKPLNPLEIVFDDENAAKKLSPIQQIQLPANLPPQLVQNIYGQVLQQIQVISIDPINYEVFNATLESIRCKSQFRSKNLINAARLPDMNIKFNAFPLSQGWYFEEKS